MSADLKQAYGDYRDGSISRREFFRRAAILTGGIAAAHSLLDSLGAGEAGAAMVKPNDPSILWHNVEFDSKTGPVSGYLARPSGPGKFPAVIVVHENRGLNDHIRDVARRLAKEGYVALAPDYLSHAGGTAKVNPKGGGIGNIREIAPSSGVVADNRAAVSYLGALSDVRAGRIGVVGFCWGGGMAFLTAAQIPAIDAAVVYYGASPNPLDQLKNLKAPVLAHYGGEDPNINKGIPATEKAMTEYKKSYTYKIYPGAKHAFNNDTNEERYNAAAAKEAWGKTLDFFAKNLKA